MGEDFLRKKHRDFKRRTDAALKHLTRRDLFSAIAADVDAEVVGLLSPGMELPTGAYLSENAERSIDSSRILLYCNSSKAVELDGEAAAQIRRAEKKFGAPLRKTVKEVTPEGLVRIAVSYRAEFAASGQGGGS